MPDLVTPFRDHYERSRTLDCERQIQECADYLQHPEVLITEFLESYYLIERRSDPAIQRALDEEDGLELVLEPFHDSFQIDVVDDDGLRERIECASGAFDPVPTAHHPALRRRGLDYVGARAGSSRIVLGVTAADDEATIYLLFLRALNCLAEVAPPFQLARLQRLVMHERIRPDAAFDLQVGLPEPPAPGPPASLWQLTRDLAEAIKSHILQHPQFSATLGSIESLYLDSVNDGVRAVCRLGWRA